jgi:hypothetical protein
MATELETFIEKVIDTFFHLPTLLIMTLLSLIVLWIAFDMQLEIGQGFARLSTNQGTINLFWIRGCCQIRF